MLAAGGRPTNLDNGRARAYCIYCADEGCLDIFSLAIISLFSLSWTDG